MPPSKGNRHIAEALKLKANDVNKLSPPNSQAEFKPSHKGRKNKHEGDINIIFNLITKIMFTITACV